MSALKNSAKEIEALKGQVQDLSFSLEWANRSKEHYKREARYWKDQHGETLGRWRKFQIDMKSQ